MFTMRKSPVQLLQWWFKCNKNSLKIFKQIIHKEIKIHQTGRLLQSYKMLRFIDSLYRLQNV